MEIISKSDLSQNHDSIIKVRIMNIDNYVREQNKTGEGFYKQTKKYYDNCAEYYDYLYPDHIKYSKKLFDSLEPIFKQNNVKKILDASCGVGHDMKCLLNKGFKVDGADISSPMIKKAKDNLCKLGYNDFSFYNIDVREIAEKIGYEKYDAVIFRGNTFSNIKPTDIHLVIEQLYKVIKKNGFVCIDFRNGKHQLSSRKVFEIRGIKLPFNILQGFFSFYVFKHSSFLNKTYKVKAYIINFHKVIKLNINSFYVDDNALEENLTRVFGDINKIDIKVKGLPFLETLICKK